MDSTAELTASYTSALDSALMPASMIIAPSTAFGDLPSVDTEEVDLVGLGVALGFFGFGSGVRGGLEARSFLTRSGSFSNLSARLVIIAQMIARYCAVESIRL